MYAHNANAIEGILRLAKMAYKSYHIRLDAGKTLRSPEVSRYKGETDAFTQALDEALMTKACEINQHGICKFGYRDEAEGLVNGSLTIESVVAEMPTDWNPLEGMRPSEQVMTLSQED